VSGAATAVRDGGETATLVLAGELDLLAVPALAGQLVSALNARPGRLVFDLAGVTFLDCAAARLIARAGEHLVPPGQPVLTGCRPAVRRVFGLAGLARYVEMLD
jgi:anti-anti-sigma factor